MLGRCFWASLLLYIVLALAGCGQDDRVRTSKQTTPNPNPELVPDNPPQTPKVIGEFDEEELLHLPVKSNPGEFMPRPDGRDIAVVLHTTAGEPGEMVLAGGKKGERFDRVENLTYSPDSKHLVFEASNGGTYSVDGKYSGGRHFIVLDGQVVSADYDQAAQPVFSLDGKLAYLATKDGKPLVIYDDKVLAGNYAALGDLVFSPNSQRLAYPAQLPAGNWCVVVDGQAGPAFDEVGQPAFSPDSKRFVYAVRKGAKWSVAVDHKAGAEFDAVRQPRIAPDNKTVGYLANLGGMVGETGKFEGGKWFVVLGETRDKRNFDDANGFAFTPQGFPAFAARTGEDWQVVVGDNPGPKFDRWLGLPIVFSAQGLPAYTAVKDGHLYLAAGMKMWIDVESKARPLGPVWSADGSKVRFIVYYPAVNKFRRQVLDQE